MAFKTMEVAATIQSGSFNFVLRRNVMVCFPFITNSPLISDRIAESMFTKSAKVPRNRLTVRIGSFFRRSRNASFQNVTQITSCFI